MKPPTLEDAIALALDAHRGTPQKDGSPYILHPLAVMLSLDTEAERMVGVLHDVVEDTPITLDELRERGYPDDVLAALDCLTRRDDESYEQFIERVLPNPLARRVKLADIAHNLDVRRLPVVTAADATRMERYRAAWVRLKAASDT